MWSTIQINRIVYKYAKKAKGKNRQVNPHYADNNCPDLKPRTGLLERAAVQINTPLSYCSVYFIGDRFSDVLMGLNANGQGHLITGWKTKQIGDEDKVRALAEQPEYTGRVFIHNSFLDAARAIFKDHTKGQ